MKKLLKKLVVLFLSSLVIIFNVWYFIICAFSPEYYQNTNLTSNEIIRFEKLYHIDFPDETKFIKAREYLAGLRRRYVSCIICVSANQAGRKSFI